MTEIAVRQSNIGEPGVFTLEHLQANQVVCEFRLGREVTAESPLRPEFDERPEHCPCIDDHFYLVPPPERYLNHSCDPTVFLRFGAERIEVVTRRELSADTELTIDYLINNPGGDSWLCRCGAPRCRGETGKSFFSLPEAVRSEYLPLLAPWFRKRYASELERIGNAPRTGASSPRPLYLTECLLIGPKENAA